MLSGLFATVSLARFVNPDGPGGGLQVLLTGILLELFKWYLATREKKPWLDNYLMTVILAALFAWMILTPGPPGAAC